MERGKKRGVSFYKSFVYLSNIVGVQGTITFIDYITVSIDS